jgi:hypothetical protein
LVSSSPLVGLRRGGRSDSGVNPFDP